MYLALSTIFAYKCISSGDYSGLLPTCQQRGNQVKYTYVGNSSYESAFKSTILCRLSKPHKTMQSCMSERESVSAGGAGGTQSPCRSARCPRSLPFFPAAV